MRIKVLTILIILIFFAPSAFCTEREEFNTQLKTFILNSDHSAAFKTADLALQEYSNDEVYLKIKADAAWNMNRFDDAIEIYEYFITLYPYPRYLADFEEIKAYKTVYEHSKMISVHVDSNIWDMNDVIPLFLNVMFNQQLLEKAYQAIKKFGLQDMAIEHNKAEDLFLLDNPTQEEFQKFYNDPVILKLKQANILQAQIKPDEAEMLYREVLRDDPQNIDAQMGLGYVELNRHNYKKALRIFENIAKNRPSYTDAQVAVSGAYLSDADYVNSLDVADELPPSLKTNYLKGLIYEEMMMWDSSRNSIINDYTERADELRGLLKTKTCPIFTPRHSFLIQTLNNTIHLNSHKTGFNYIQEIGKNLHGIFSYTGISFVEPASPTQSGFRNITNDVMFGLGGRIAPKWEVQGMLGTRAFGGGGAMLLTDSWVKYYLSDKFDIQLGVSRFNVEESFLAAVGNENAAGVFTGRVPDTRLGLLMNWRLPKKWYAYFKGDIGERTGNNLPSNNFADGLLGIGKLVYKNYENPFINMVAIDAVTYNAAFQHDVLASTGAYYSPPYFNASSLNLRSQGYNRKLKLRYGIKAFVANQVAPGNQINTIIGVGVVPYISWQKNDHFTFNALFHYSNFANIQKYYATFQLQFKFFTK